jgi:hypothetical protein
LAIYLLASLGLCEHCGALLSLENLSIEAIDAEWRCSKCGGILNGPSFGYEGTDEGTKKVWWVGPDGKWTKKPPVKPFNLGNWRIIISPRN